MLALEVPEILTMAETCEILNCHPNTVRNWVKSGRISCIRFGSRGDRRFVKDDVLKLLTGNENDHPLSKAVSTNVKAKNDFHAKGVDLYQQDCIAFLKSLENESVDLIVTDPAYSGMNRHLQLGKGRIVGNYQKDITGKWFEEFEDTTENYFAFLSECKRVLKPNSHIFIMFDSYSLISLGPVVREVFDLKNIVVWDKLSIGMGHYFRRRHEFILFASKGKRPVSARNIPDVWQIKKIHGAKYPTQKPVALFEKMITSSVEKGSVICDPFFGSGSAAVAALKQGCYFTGADISGKAFDFASERIAGFIKTGRDVAE